MVALSISGSVTSPPPGGHALRRIRMTDLAVARGRGPLGGRLAAQPAPAVAGLDTRRALQLVLAALWLLDGVLQYQPFMYTKAFAQMLGSTAAGNPSVIARPVTWDASLVGDHLVLLNIVFATIQLLLGLGIAFRPTVRVALAASVAWSLGVWWFGEGLGGVLNGGAGPLNGAPGAVIIYALIAVLLWPADRPGGPAPFVAARAVGAQVARALWLVFWLSQAYFALTPGNRAPEAVSQLIAGMNSGEPRWLAALLRGATSLTAHQGLAASVVLAVAFAVIAAGVYLPPSAAKAALVLAIVTAAVIWVFAQALGGILASGATDPNSGPLLILLALAYWPARPAAPGRTAEPAPPAAEGNLA
jgi:hypothetical protein